jgi:hypothetical protein
MANIDKKALKEVSQDDFEKLVKKKLTDEESALLTHEVNQELLTKLIAEQFSNVLMLDIQAGTVSSAVIDKFLKKAMAGELSKFIYAGSTDVIEKRYENERRHNALFVRLSPDDSIDMSSGNPFVEYFIWNRKHPGYNENGEWAPGNSYAIEIEEKPDTDREGNPVTYYNLQSYFYQQNMGDVLVALINSQKTLAEAVKDSVEGVDFEESVVTLLSEKILYETVTVEFNVTDVFAMRRRERIKDGQFYGYKPVDVKDPQQYEPVMYTHENGNSNVVFALRGEAAFDDERKLSFYVSFYPQRFGQTLIISPLLLAVQQRNEFMQAKPEQQTDFLKILFAGKKMRVVGRISRVEGADDGKRLNLSINGMCLIEQTEPEA